MKERKKCEHGKIPYICKNCGGKGICKHKVQKRNCIKCNGSGICLHKKHRSICRECKGSQICEHNNVKCRCKECKGKSICSHSRIRYECPACGGFIILAKRMCSAAKRRAERDNVPFEITKEDILSLFGNGFCPILGIKYDLLSAKITNASANLDRFIPELGYTKENCVVMSRLANSIKSNATTEQVHLVAEWMKQQEQKRLDNQSKF